MPSNFYWFFIVALIPLLVGFLWYGKMMFGNKWMNINGFTEDDLQGGNMPVIFGVSYIFSVMVAFALSGLVIHQNGIAQSMMPDLMQSGSEAQQLFTQLMTEYGGRFRTFGHGALHGVVGAIFFVLPIIGINALFERRGWTYTFIHTGYWVVCLALMGGILCKVLEWAPLS